LILDEATSALDRKNEAEVQKAIDAIQRSSSSLTTIVIAHRLSTIRNADKIIVMKRGEIVEVGDHESLLEEYPDGVYSELVSKQQIKEDDKDDESDQEESDSPTVKHRSSVDKKVSDMKHRRTSNLEEEKSKTAQANQEYEEMEKVISERLKRNIKRGVFCRLIGINKPTVLIFTGLFGSLIQGSLFPVFAIFWTKILFVMMKTDNNEIKDGVHTYALWMFIMALITLFATIAQKMSFGILSDNMTRSLRSQLYVSILRKHIGWFDHEGNSPGQLTSVMSGEIQTVNGASSESIGSMIEAFLQLAVGIILAFFFEWRISLVMLGVAPIITISSFIQTKIKQGATVAGELNLKESNSLVSDCILNNITVASFGHEYLIVDKYKELLEIPMQDSIKKSHLQGITFGFSQFAMFAVYSLLFYVAAKFIEKYDVKAENMFLAIFIIMFSAYGSGQAQQYAPSAGKGKQAAIRIYNIIDEESELDPQLENEGEVIANSGEFKGNIEFRDVWFRYPTRRDHWVLKGLNLKIGMNQTVGLAGESGCGKSTIIQLLYRFYEPQFGHIFIDGINIKDYNVASLRRQYGLVQQEPILFNYSVRENIAYAKVNATNQEILDAAEIANATEFISTLQAHTNEDEKPMNIFDEEENATEDPIQLPPGYLVSCGVKGGKLSGGQKQRIAIARAIVRKPQVLMLDEATSALDEDSQNKVQVALDRIMKDRTTIVIAHRLTTIQKCDKIFVLRYGKVEEEGTFAELMKKKGYFAQISSDFTS